MVKRLRGLRPLLDYSPLLSIFSFTFIILLLLPYSLSMFTAIGFLSISAIGYIIINKKKILSFTSKVQNLLFLFFLFVLIILFINLRIKIEQTQSEIIPANPKNIESFDVTLTSQPEIVFNQKMRSTGIVEKIRLKKGEFIKTHNNVTIYTDALPLNALSGTRIRVFDNIYTYKEKNNNQHAYVSYPRLKQIHIIENSNFLSQLNHDINLEIINIIRTFTNKKDMPIILALILGKSNQIPFAEINLFRKSGAYHVLALSGMHLGIILLFFSLLFSPLMGKKISRIIALLTAFAFVWLTGFKVSLLRSLFMASTFFAATVFYRRIGLLPVISLTALLFAIINPAFIHSVSYQLSFMALVGIAFTSPYILQRLSPKCPRFLAGPLSISLSAQIWVSPVLLYHFGTVSPAGIISSVLVVPFVIIIMVLGLIGIGINVFAMYQLNIFLKQIINFLHSQLDNILSFFAETPLIDISGQSKTIPFVLIVFLFLSFYITQIRSSLRRIF